MNSKGKLIFLEKMMDFCCSFWGHFYPSNKGKMNNSHTEKTQSFQWDLTFTLCI